MIKKIKLSFKNFFVKIKRSLDYAIFGYSNPDWDYAYIYNLLEFKLRRIEKELLSGPAEQKAKDMRALRKLIRLCILLANKDYEDKYFKILNKKWRLVKIQLKEKGLDIFDNKEYVEGLRDCVKMAEFDRRKHVDMLADILKESSVSWWN